MFGGVLRKCMLGNIDWDNILVGDTQECWNTFKQLLYTVEVKFVPTKLILLKVRRNLCGLLIKQ
jgi:hypothetical protein